MEYLDPLLPHINFKWTLTHLCAHFIIQLLYSYKNVKNSFKIWKIVLLGAMNFLKISLSHSKLKFLIKLNFFLKINSPFIFFWNAVACFLLLRELSQKTVNSEQNEMTKECCRSASKCSSSFLFFLLLKTHPVAHIHRERETHTHRHTHSDRKTNIHRHKHTHIHTHTHTHTHTP